MKGAQASIDVVSAFQKQLDELVKEAEAHGVVLTIDIVSLQPLAMGNVAMHPLARPVWWNSDHLAIAGSTAAVI